MFWDLLDREWGGVERQTQTEDGCNALSVTKNEGQVLDTSRRTRETNPGKRSGNGKT